MRLTNLLITICIGLLSLVALRFHQILGNEPYMDEIFHIKQAQLYCKGKYFTWDSKITTFPGLYLASAGVYHIYDWLFEASDSRGECSIFFLRLSNMFFVFLSFPLCFLLRNMITKKSNDGLLYALLISVYPLSAFYYFLYYTDTASTCLLILTYFMSSTQTSFYSQLNLLFISTLAVLMRQTNAVWLLFFAGIRMIATLENTSSIGIDSPVDSASAYFSRLWTFLLALLKSAPVLTLQTAGLLVTTIWFSIFVAVNGGIVVGDRAHHRPVIHMAMPLHMVTLSTLMISPCVLLDMWSQRDILMQNLRPARLLWHTVGVVIVSAVLAFGSLSHPFLLADNRHYTFYLWKRILQHREYRLMLGLPYYACLQCFIGRLRAAGRGPIWMTVYGVAVMLTLLPAHLLEPRYFTPAVVVFMLNNPEANTPPQKVALICTILLCVLFNIASLFIFIERPFTASGGLVSRFMY